MSTSSYDPKTNIYTVKIPKDELMEAFKSRRAYRDFLFKNFGFHLTEEDLMKARDEK